MTPNTLIDVYFTKHAYFKYKYNYPIKIQLLDTTTLAVVGLNEPIINKKRTIYTYKKFYCI